MRWLVLSDIHFQFKNFNTEIARQKLIKVISEEAKKEEISFILITGDCLHKHQADEKSKNQLRDFIEQIERACENKKRGKKRKGDISVYICPGNHDIDRNKEIRSKSIEQYRIDAQLPSIDICDEGYQDFDYVHLLLTHRPYNHFSAEIYKNFRIINIDTSLLSLDDNDTGQLSVFFPELAKLEIEKDDKINIVIMHHGVEFLKPEDGRKFQHWLADNHIDMVFCGHNHAVGMQILTEAIVEENGPQNGIPQFTCGAALSDSYARPSFYICEYTNAGELNVKLYEYQNNSKWMLANNELRSFPNGSYCEKSKKNIVEKVYPTIFEAADDISQDIRRSSKLCFFGLRGKTFLQGNTQIGDAISERAANLECRLLVSDPYNNNIEKRLRNVPEFSTQVQLEKQWKRIYEDICQLRNLMKGQANRFVRFHQQPLLQRFILTDYALYVGYYSKEPSSKSKMYKYSSESDLYMSMGNFFDASWAAAGSDFDSVIPDRCSFLSGKFDMQPSLVLNLTDECNMKCRYCPEGGENLSRCKELCSIETLLFLMKAFNKYGQQRGWKEKKVLRITGGEPLLVLDRLYAVLNNAKSEEYQKIVLCTNGALIRDAYNKNPDVWENVKDVLLLKISLDTMSKGVFSELTGTDKLTAVIAGIEFMKRKGFKIELNLVATKDNVSEIENIYNYAHRIGLVGVKVLTINDFGGKIQPDNVEAKLNKLINRMRSKKYVETGLYVHNNKGIHMKRFIHDGCTLTIVDHLNQENSVTPRRTYSQACQSCYFYPQSVQVQNGDNTPCATGIMSLTMRADGMLSFCRLRNDRGTPLGGKTEKEIEDCVKTEMQYFEDCYHYEIGEAREKI